MFSHYENIFTAALDHGDLGLADKYLQLLIKKFPNSNRVKRLMGLSFESQGDFAAALDIYDEILKDTPSNLLVMKRKVLVTPPIATSRSDMFSSIPDTLQPLHVLPSAILKRSIDNGCLGCGVV